MQAIFNIIFLVLVGQLFSLFHWGWIICIIWLAFLGEWSVIGISFIMMWGGILMCKLLAFPSIAITPLIVRLLDRGAYLRVCGAGLGAFKILWIWVAASGWGVFSFYFLAKWSDFENILLYLLLACAIAGGPWARLLGSDPHGIMTRMIGLEDAHSDGFAERLALRLPYGIYLFPTLFLGVSCVTFLVVVLYFDSLLEIAWLILGGIMVAGLVIDIAVRSVTSCVSLAEWRSANTGASED